jgi:hypothetical protein
MAVAGARPCIMNGRKTQDRSAVAREMFSRRAGNGSEDVAIGPLPVDTIDPGKSGRHYGFEPEEEAGFDESSDSSLLPVSRVDEARLLRVLQELETIARRHAPRIAFKEKGRILFLHLAEVAAVRAEGNYVSLRHHPHPYLLRESLSSIAEKLKPYGFIRIHRSVVVNISAVEEMQALPTGEYKLRVKGGEEYLVTRTYKNNLRDLAQLWIGSERRYG